MKFLSKRLTAEAFNAKYPVGTPVRYFQTSGEPSYRDSKTRTTAWTLGHGAAVVSIEGQAGGVAITHIQIRKEEGL
ncbi:hypothetical protein JUN65_08370 [Gluconacetobacter azotocaptans]|uniref:hypothetical protein n=1 Tax=Gluconacetobacter azotocaptans TaxID=142834 RepID=UPI00195BAF63|nr:hypothetical protein [Gluconacetobacter azotocaptans]MBM9401600.1 hypothetical protein [Gluconacetobacter azotocaptans]